MCFLTPHCRVHNPQPVETTLFETASYNIFNINATPNKPLKEYNISTPVRIPSDFPGAAVDCVAAAVELVDDELFASDCLAADDVAGPAVTTDVVGVNVWLAAHDDWL